MRGRTGPGPRRPRLERDMARSLVPTRDNPGNNQCPQKVSYIIESVKEDLVNHQASNLPLIILLSRKKQ